ncbi:hypothetical protein DERP_013292 [Dermatophagoides pteronyssinus]|uniref:Uncharacterized protein n=1 Tax=Dermatophagoides pteronyssinus TaxID=6956 RepID=A0ABQ8J3N5_DERPT|nr:hypothetical protein DERP_013292 [Dermatophagoides pteronyssinus]
MDTVRSIKIDRETRRVCSSTPYPVDILQDHHLDNVFIRFWTWRPTFTRPTRPDRNSNQKSSSIYKSDLSKKNNMIDIDI